MGSHPINLAVRFLLELTALVVMGAWGWQQNEGWIRFLLAIGIPIFFAALWGIFAVPDDPSRSGEAPVPVPGWLRLLLELAFFAIGTWMLYQMGAPTLGIVFGIAVLVHYAVSYDRVGWLIRQ